MQPTPAESAAAASAPPRGGGEAAPKKGGAPPLADPACAQPIPATWGRAVSFGELLAKELGGS
eukprot:7061106-Prymnesium_polylepis.2